jgi:hypothetical protein
MWVRDEATHQRGTGLHRDVHLLESRILPVTCGSGSVIPMTISLTSSRRVVQQTKTMSGDIYYS